MVSKLYPMLYFTSCFLVRLDQVFWSEQEKDLRVGGHNVWDRLPLVAAAATAHKRTSAVSIIKELIN